MKYLTPLLGIVSRLRLIYLILVLFLSAWPSLMSPICVILVFPLNLSLLKAHIFSW